MRRSTSRHIGERSFELTVLRTASPSHVPKAHRFISCEPIDDRSTPSVPFVSVSGGIALYHYRYF